MTADKTLDKSVIVLTVTHSYRARASLLLLSSPDSGVSIEH